MSYAKEFKAFVNRGNVLDLAVGVLIGGAFGKIVSSLVNDLIAPPLGFLLKEVDLKRFKWVVKAANENGAEIAITYGAFLQTVLDFLITAFAIFWVVKAANKLKKKEAETPPPPKEPTAEEVLLAEIRDLLKAQTEK